MKHLFIYIKCEILLMILAIALINCVNAKGFDPSMQKLADKPSDRPLTVDVGKNYYCYTPVFTGGEGYLLLDSSSCGTKRASISRYDIFQRVAFEVNSTWLCLTAPDNVTGYEGEKTSTWDYVILRPCVINDPNQRWIIKNQSFYTQDGKYRLQDKKAYAVISDGNIYTNQTLNSRMKQWMSLVARPVTMAIKTRISWKIDDFPKPQYYYLGIYTSYKTMDSPWLYYNTQDGRIFSYFSSTGRQMCLSTSQLFTQQWNWSSWVSCDDFSSLDDTYWDLFIFANGTGALKDKNGNLLRVTRYGPNWGVTYTAMPSYLEFDTTHSPTSEFSMSEDMDKWLRYVDGNMGDNLEYCPAPGIKTGEHSRTKRQLPPDFQLTNEWINRLYMIATTAITGTSPSIGLCGVCLLHTHEILAELMRYGYGSPPISGGHYFDVMRHTNPFTTFTQRFPDLASRLEGAINFVETPLNPDEDRWSRRRRLIYAMNQTFSPQNFWSVTPIATNAVDIRGLYDAIADSPLGSLWTISMVYMRMGQTNLVGHSQPMIRTRQGVIMLPTNVPTYSLENYRSELTPITTRDQFLRRLTSGGTLIILATFAFRVNSFQQDSYDRFISVSNCTGEGDGSRGNARFPRINVINQCLSGRCAIQ